MISIFLNLLRFDMWPKMWSILEKVPFALEKKVYSSAFGWNVLKISMRSILSNVSFKTCVSLLILCSDDLSIGVSGVLKSPAIIVLLSISPFMSASIYVLRGSYVGRIDIYNCCVFLLGWTLDHYVVSFLISCNCLYFNVYFVWYEDCYYSSFASYLHGIYFSILSLSVYMCFDISSGFFVDSIYMDPVLYPFNQSVSFGWSI